jgi:two-component system cell cycle response regulator
LAHVLIVDDSASVRSLLGARLRENGHVVDEAADGESGAERAVVAPPDVVVTDLLMKGISGVQLCRILRNEPATAHIPVVLLTASGDKRSRFWARSAGAAAYLSKDRLSDLVGLIPTLLASRASPATHASLDRPVGARRTLQERMSAILDGALFDSVIAGEVRSLASSGALGKLFEGLVALLADVLSYRWLVLLPSRAYAPAIIHAHPTECEAIGTMARSVLGIAPARTIDMLADERAVPGEGSAAETWPVIFAGAQIGQIGIAPTVRGLSREDRRVLALVATELGGPLQMSALYEDAQRLATTDALTGILNRRAFLDNIERERARSDRFVLPFSVMLLDLDHFKAINDNRGHAAGDAVLQGIARVLEAVARKSDFVARWGGEEFVVALPQTAEGGARIAAERVRRAIAEASHPVPHGEPLRVTASIGISSSDSPWKHEALLAAADAAMYAAKARGRNRVESLPAAESPTSIRRMRAAVLTAK